VLAMQKHRRGNGWAMTLSDASGERDYPINPILVANDPAALKGALLCGEGLMLGADVMVKSYLEQGHLQRVLAGWTGQEYEFNAVFPRGHVQSPKVRAFVDFLVERMKFDVDYMMEHCPVYLKQQAEARAAAETAPEAEAAAAVGRKVLADVLS
jgi:LysR family transcriptional regulator for bpeEF and oprC